MNEYALHMGARTHFLNFFRRLFTFSILEKIVVKNAFRKKNSLWQKLIPPNYLYKAGSLRNSNINGIEFQLDISNVMEHMVYFNLEPENFKTVGECIKKSKIIFDIGANIGATALFFASKNPIAEIYSFEPHPETYQKALRNIGKNKFDKIQLINAGLGAAKESKKLYEVIATNYGMNRIMPGDNPYPFKIVDIITLDDFCIERGIDIIDFIKIDVEGFEYFVVTGGKEILSKSKAVVYLELYDHGLKKHGYSANALIELLSDLGYNNFINAYTLSAITQSTDLTGCDFDIIAEKRQAG